MEFIKQLQTNKFFHKLPIELENIIIDYVKDIVTLEQTWRNYSNVVKEFKTLKFTSNGIQKIVDYRVTPVRGLRRPIYKQLLGTTCYKQLNTVSLCKINKLGYWVNTVFFVV